MKKHKHTGKNVLSNLLTLLAIILWLWIIGSVVEIGTHNTEKGYTYSRYNLLVWMFPED